MGYDHYWTTTKQNHALNSYALKEHTTIKHPSNDSKTAHTAAKRYNIF